MGYPTRIHYMEADKALMWDRWRKGESLNEKGREPWRSCELMWKRGLALLIAVIAPQTRCFIR